ncbi:hypothetical protein O6H91_11G001200 [Diphasiastrum complanatum]|nr:hypothetical protein O6H91_11G001200 [Diphasiastrum complanatum]
MESDPFFKEVVKRECVQACCPSYLCMFGGPCSLRLKVPQTVVSMLNDGRSFSHNFLVLKDIITGIGSNLWRICGFIRKTVFNYGKLSDKQTSAALQSTSWLSKASRNKDDKMIEAFIQAESGFVLDMHKGLVSSPGRLKITFPEKDATVEAGYADALFKEGIFVLHKGVSALMKTYHLKAVKVTLYGCNSLEDHSKPEWLSRFLRPFCGLRGDKLKNGSSYSNNPSKGEGMQEYIDGKEDIIEAFRSRMIEFCVDIPKISSRRKAFPTYGDRYTVARSINRTSKIIIARRQNWRFFSWNFQQLCSKIVTALKASVVVRCDTQPRGKNFLGVEVGLTEWLDDHSWRDTSAELPRNVFDQRFSMGICTIQNAKGEQPLFCRDNTRSLLVAETI